MRLIAISHDRCDELDKTEYFVAPDEMTDEQIDYFINEAHDEYLSLYDLAKEKNPSPQHITSHVTDKNFVEDMTIGEARRMIEENQQLRNEHADLVRKIAGTFDAAMERHGIVPIWKVQPRHEITVIWGHRHGQDLKY